MAVIRDLTLTQFRNYSGASIRDLNAGFVILVGENGAGKTNCLEAVSLLSPGRGLRSASSDDLQLKREGGAPARQEYPNSWAVAANIYDPMTEENLQIGTGDNPQKSGRRIAKINGEAVSALTKLSEFCNAVWLTPAQHGLFIGSISERRRFFDRLVFSFDPSHAGRVRRYEKALSERSKILKEALRTGSRPDPIWLDGVELTLSESAVSIAASRLLLLEKLQHFCKEALYDDFVPMKLSLISGAEEMLLSKAAIDIEEELKDAFKQARQVDAQFGGSVVAGAHKTDFDVVYETKNMPAAQCSTGEQKSMLITLILAHARLIHAQYGTIPLLILDEITAHLDSQKRTNLFDILSSLKGQVWMSGTERSLFSEAKNAQLIKVENNSLMTL